MPGSVTIDEPHAHIRRLTLVHEGRKNAMDAAMRDALHPAVRDAVADPGVHAVILTGAGGDFCSGGDINGLREIAPETMAGRFTVLHDILRLLIRARKPIIASAAGVAAGGGAGLMLACDHVIVAESARVAITFMRIGLLPDMGLLHTLVRRIGYGPARRMLLDPGAIDAAACLRMGLADQVVSDASLAEAATQCALRLANHPPGCWAETKSALETLPPDLEAVFALEASLQPRLMAAWEFREGTAAFLEKRLPQYRRANPA